MLRTTPARKRELERWQALTRVSCDHLSQYPGTLLSQYPSSKDSQYPGIMELAIVLRSARRDYVSECPGTLIPGTLGYGYPGTLGYWYPGMLGYWDSGRNESEKTSAVGPRDGCRREATAADDDAASLRHPAFARSEVRGRTQVL